MCVCLSVCVHLISHLDLEFVRHRHRGFIAVARDVNDGHHLEGHDHLVSQLELGPIIGLVLELAQGDVVVGGVAVCVLISVCVCVY